MSYKKGKATRRARLQEGAQLGGDLVTKVFKRGWWYEDDRIATKQQLESKCNQLYRVKGRVRPETSSQPGRP